MPPTAIVVDPEASAVTAPAVIPVPDRAAVHPIVLLSVVDHYHRAALNTSRRAVGILLGAYHPGDRSLALTSSFAVPFEEDERQPGVFYLDHNYVETMLGLLRKVNARETMVGWYTTGTRLRANDALISQLLVRRGFHPVPIVLVVDVEARHAPGGLDEDSAPPATAYFPREELHDDGRPAERTFLHVPTLIEAEEAEEVGVEHLLRDVNADAVARTRTLTGQAKDRVQALAALAQRLDRIRAYLDRVTKGEIPAQPRILHRLQDALNLLPELAVNAATMDEGMREALRFESHDSMMAVYLASLVRSTIAMHGLVDNQIERREVEAGSAKAEVTKTEAVDANKDEAAVSGSSKK